MKCDCEHFFNAVGLEADSYGFYTVYIVVKRSANIINSPKLRNKGRKQK